GALSSKDRIPRLELCLLPGLSRVTAEKIRISQRVDVTTVGQGIAALLNRYRDNITGELTRAPFSHYTLPAMAPDAFDISRSIHKMSGATDFKVEVAGRPLNVPLKWDGLAWLVARRQITALLQLSHKDQAVQHRRLKSRKSTGPSSASLMR